MPLQHFWQSPAPVEFAHFTDGRIGSPGVGLAAPLLNSIYYVAATDMIVGVFVTTSKDMGVRQSLAVRYQFQKIWRAGVVIDIGDSLPQIGHTCAKAAQGAYNPTTDGRVVRAPQVGTGFSEKVAQVIEDAASQGSSNITYLVLDFDAGSNLAYNAFQNYYVVDPLWPGNIIVPGAIMDSQLMGRSQRGLVDAVNQVGYVMELSTAGTIFTVASLTAVGGSYTSTLVLGPINESSYRGPKEIVPIDSSSVMIVFRESPGATGNNQNQPAWVRVYDTQKVTGSWTLLWEDELPCSDGAATYDPTRGVVYSINKHESAAYMNASWLKRRPTQIAVPTIKGGATELVPLTGQTLSTLVLHGSGGVTGHTSFTSFLSGELVQWTLDSYASQGSLISAYSYTDEDGSATIAYFGPALPSNLTEHVNVTVAQTAKAP